MENKEKNMISLELYDVEHFEQYVKNNYKPQKDMNDIIEVSDREVRDFFVSECKPEYIIIEYSGGIDDIERDFSLINNKIYKKFLIHISLPVSAQITDVNNVLNKLAKINMCTTAEYIVHIEVDNRLVDERFKFKLISPCYTYLDIWKWKKL